MLEYLRITNVISAFSGLHLLDPEMLKRAADRGTIVHSHIEAVLSNEWVGIVTDPTLTPYIESFAEFWEAHKHLYKDFKIETEKRLFCPKLMITGQIDVIFSSEARTYAIDWKTGSRKQKSWSLQTAAYRYLLEENGYPNVDDVLVVQLKKGKATPHKDKEYQKQLDVFKKCLEVYRYFDMGRFLNGEEND